MLKPRNSFSSDIRYPECGICIQSHPKIDSYVSKVFSEIEFHGVKYIASARLRTFERVFWALVVVALLGYSAFLMYGNIQKYYDTPIIISFEPKETPISRIQFPAITICNVNLFKTSVLTKTFDDTTKALSKSNITKKFTGQYIHPEAIAGTIHVDRLGQLCMTAPSFRRIIKDKLVDANGREDFIAMIQHDLAELDDSYRKVFELFAGTVEDKPQVVFDEAAMNCEDMILSCVWAGQEIPCREHFRSLDTRHGRCCVFNMMPKYLLQNINKSEERAQNEMKKLHSEAIKGWEAFFELALANKIDEVKPDKNSKYPKFQMAGGSPYGLSVLINPELHEYSTCTVNDGLGFKLVAHNPLSSPSIMDYGVAVPINSEIFIDIEPHIIKAGPEIIQKFTAEQRGCYSPEDPEAKLEHFSIYSYENCFSECISNQTYKICECVAYFMPRDPSFELCGAKKRKCVEDVRGSISIINGTKSLCSHCKPSCNEVIYKLEMSQFDIRQDEASSHFTYKSFDGSLKNASNYSILHIYFGEDSINIKTRKTIYDTSDLIANAGGFLGLTLGMSIISIIEIIYFSTLRAFMEFLDYRKTKPGGESGNSSQGNWGWGQSHPKLDISQTKRLDRPISPNY